MRAAKAIGSRLCVASLRAAPRPGHEIIPRGLGKLSCPGCCAARSGALLIRGLQLEESHRHFAVPYRRAGGQGFRRIDDGVGVDAVVAVELADRSGLAKMLDAESLDAVAADAA